MAPPVAEASSVTVVAPTVTIFVPTGMSGWDTTMPATRPAVEILVITSSLEAPLAGMLPVFSTLSGLTADMSNVHVLLTGTTVYVEPW